MSNERQFGISLGIRKKEIAIKLVIYYVKWETVFQFNLVI